MNRPLQGYLMPVALVTGANRGLGLEMVRQLLTRGYTVHATHRTSPGGLVDIDHEQLHLHQLDVRDGAAIAEMTTGVGSTLDLLINNAGIADGRWPSVSAIDFEVAGEVLEVNAIAPVRICLLYTSPSPRDRTTSRMPSSA